MESVFFTESAILFQFETVWSIFFVFVFLIVAAFAFRATKSDGGAHQDSPFLTNSSRLKPEDSGILTIDASEEVLLYLSNKGRCPNLFADTKNSFEKIYSGMLPTLPELTLIREKIAFEGFLAADYQHNARSLNCALQSVGLPSRKMSSTFSGQIFSSKQNDQ